MCGGKISTHPWLAVVVASSVDGQVRPTLEVRMTRTNWVHRWKYVMEATPTKPGVWKLKKGGCYVRGRVTDPRTGRQHAVSLPLHDATAAEAYGELQRRLAEIRSGRSRDVQPRTRFAEFAAALLERKVLRNEIRSAKTRLTWKTGLEKHLLPVFGEVYLDALTRNDIEEWLDAQARKVQAGSYSPVTVNGWYSLLRVIVNEATVRLELDRNPIAGVQPLDVSGHRAYSEEEPNALTAGELQSFIGVMRRRWPQHFAMTALGFATGLRPSSMRPLRRQGATPDVLWDVGVLLVRQSHTVGDEVMASTKTRRYQRLALPDELMEIFRWHVAGLAVGPMQASELLFPSETGGFRAPSCLDKPFADVAMVLDLGKRITPRGMRRTFQDLARAAQVTDVVTRAISGHATESMQLHYSSVSGDEMKQSLARVVDLAGYRKALAS